MTNTETPPIEGPAAGRKGRPQLAIFLLIMGVILAPLTTVAIFAKNQITNTDRYVETVSPLASDPAIQEAVGTFVVDQLFAAVDVEELAAEALPKKAQFLAAPLAAGVQNLTKNVVDRFLASDEFAQLWDTANRAAHDRIVSALTGETPSGKKAITVDDGTVSLNLGPVIEKVAQKLGADNLAIFERIDLPVASTQFKILDTKNLGVARAGVSFLETLAWILPILMILCFVGSALLARDRRRATIRAGVAVAMTAGAILVILNIGRTLFVDLMIGNSLSVDAGTALYDTVLRFVKASLLAVGVIGLIVAISAWLTGPAGAAVRVRGALKSGISGLRDQAESSGWEPGPVAQYVADHLKILRWAVIGAAFVLLLLVGRTSVGSVLLLVVLALIALGVLEFMGRATTAKDPSDEKSEKTPDTSSN